MKYFDFELLGIKRKLPFVKVNDKMALASFVVLSDTELVQAAAPELVKRLPEVDLLMTAEAKGIILTYEMSRLMGMKDFIVARKSVKPYMTDPLSSTVLSITTQKPQTLCLDSADARLLRGRRVAIVDDVISTGESLRAMEELLHACDANIIARAAILAEDKAADRDDIIYLERLPLFDAETGKVL